MEERVILVDENNNEIGTEEKLAAHKAGKLHRAFSIFVFNPEGKLLLQKRAASKYHSGGLWTNACCSHPRPDEKLEEAIHRRLTEEMGFDCNLSHAFDFVYSADFSNGLKEHEFDHVFIGTYDGTIKPNPSEADSFKWIDPIKLKDDTKIHPEKYSEWFKISIDRVLDFQKRVSRK